MKVRIKKDGKKKEFKLISSWKEVTLEKWLKLLDFQEGTKSEEARDTIEALSNIPKNTINQLELKDVAVIMGRVSEMQQKQDSSLKRIIEVGGKQYGFHPNLDDITLGEYIIEAYDGNISIRAEEMKKMSAEQVQSALVFFYNLGNELLKILPLYLMERLKEMKKQLPQNPSQKNGVGLE